MSVVRRAFATQAELLFKTSQPGPLRFVRVFSCCLVLEPLFVLGPALISYGMGDCTLGELGLYMSVNGLIFACFYVSSKQGVVRGATKHSIYSITYQPGPHLLEIKRVGLLGFLRTKRVPPSDIVPYKSRFNPLLTYRLRSSRFYKLGTDYCGNWTNRPLFERLISGEKP